MQLKISKESCKHEPDESTRTFDTMKGWRAVCKRCGAKIFLVQFVDAKRDRPLHDKKKARRRLRQQIKMEVNRGKQQEGAQGAGVARVSDDTTARHEAAQGREAAAGQRAQDATGA